ncbi:MAG: hypothetical protein ACK4TA_16295 [Saprospiraceae bacterium]
MKHLKTIYSLVVLLILVQTKVQAGGWPQPQGGGFFKLDFSFIRAREFFGMDGETYQINGAGTLLGYYTTSFYGEYGITNKLTAIGYVPFFVRNTVNEGVGAITGDILQRGLENNALGDIDLGLRYGLYQKNRWSVTAALLFGLPTGDADNVDLLFTGDGEFNQQVRLEAGYGGDRWYATGYVGFNNRTEDFSDEFRFEAEFGYKFWENRLLTGVKLTGIQSFNNGSPTGSANGLFGNNVEFLSPQLFVAYEHQQKIGFMAQVNGAVSGRNVLAAPMISAGIYLKMN